MRSWDAITRNRLIKVLISNALPGKFLDPQVKEDLIRYLDMYWFNGMWANTFTTVIFNCSTATTKKSVNNDK